MRRGGKRGGGQPQRGRGGFSGRPTVPRDESANQSKPGPKVNKFAKKDLMPTAKSMHDATRQRNRRIEDEEFLGQPPKDRDLIQTRIVLPGLHMLPEGFDAPEALDGIRKKHKVYITFVESNILELRCGSMANMRQALGTVNMFLHDMRRSSEHPAAKFFVQAPTKSSIKDKIKVELGSRPHFISHLDLRTSNASALDKHFSKLNADITASAESLMASSKQLRMRVSFGQLRVIKRKGQGRDEMTYSEFVQMVDMYSIRGGGSFQAGLADHSKAEKLIWYLVEPKNLVCNGVEELRHNTEVTLTVQGQEIIAESMGRKVGTMPISMARTIKPEVSKLLNWVVAAPDMQHDWSLRVDAWENVKTPEAFGDLSNKLQLYTSQKWEGLLMMPLLNTQKLKELAPLINHVTLKSSVAIPYKQTPYIIEVNITREWQGPNTTKDPTITWGVELYAAHWDETINYVSGRERRKDWGPALSNMWPGDEASLDSRFQEFLNTVLEVQAVLEDAQSSLNSQ